ncbi:hypothetical protein SDC9_164179 [bioreactor metagenome]|uniref:Uncharacterized protein n=1 Tax=bioreactor metagenome TaxID=1076179 RepID=A0A645FT60_9ZZZZ
MRFNRFSTGRKLVEQRNVKIAVDNQRKRARYRRCRHNKRIRRFAFILDSRALAHAEAVLLIGYDKPQPEKFEFVLNQRMRTYNYFCLAAGDRRIYFVTFRFFHAAFEQPDAIFKKTFCGSIMLRGKYVRWRHHNSLITVFQSNRQRKQC